MSAQQIDAHVAGWLSSIAEALANLRELNVDYGEFYIRSISFAFDGDDTGFALIPSDAARGFDIVIGRES